MDARRQNLQRAVAARGREDDPEGRKHELEKLMITVDILKHLATIVTIVLAALSYVGDRLAPVMRTMPSPVPATSSLWSLMIETLGFALIVSLLGLVLAALFPENRYVRILVKCFVVISFLSLVFVLVYTFEGIGVL